MTDSPLDIIDRGERNEDGDLVIKREGRFGNEHERNLTKLFQPGKRKKTDPRFLVIEARLNYEREGGLDNPAFPATPEIADQVAERIEDEPYDPAWLDGPAQRDDL